jgi:hypothetical protein
VKRIYGCAGGTGTQNFYQGSLVRIWKNVKKVAGLPNSLEDPVRTRMPRSEFGLNFPGIAPDGRKERKTLAILGFNGTDVAGYRPATSNILEMACNIREKAQHSTADVCGLPDVCPGPFVCLPGPPGNACNPCLPMRTGYHQFSPVIPCEAWRGVCLGFCFGFLSAAVPVRYGSGCN